MTDGVPFCSGPVMRRSFLQLGALGLGGLGLGDLLRLQAQASNGASAADRAVIFVWLPGGPPHMETYDMKPEGRPSTGATSGRFAPTYRGSRCASICRCTPA